MATWRELLEAKVTDRVPHTKSSLAAHFIGRDDDFWELETDKKDGGSRFKSTGCSGVECTGYAREILRRLGPNRVKIYGFHLADNPTSLIAKKAGGHDFALVDGRFIVDPWLVDVEYFSTQGVFDLLSSEDKDKVKKLYGERSHWSATL